MSELPADCTSPQLIRIGEASRLTGYKTSYLYALVHRKEIPFVRCRSRLYFDRVKLQAWLNAQMICHD